MNQMVAFVGLGNQGAPMAERILAAGFGLRVWSRRAEALAPLRAAGAAVAGELALVAEDVDILAICVTGDAATIEVARTALPNMRPGSMLLVHSTAHPQTCRNLAAEAAAGGVTLLDAPVSGGAAAARAGTLTVMVGGDASALLACRPVLESFAGTILRLGDVGAGQTAKLVNNALMAANLALAHEAISLAASLGIERDAMNRVVQASSGRSFAHSLYAGLTDLQEFAAGAALLEKDTNILDDVAARAGRSAQNLTETARRFLAIFQDGQHQE
jgi:3-hydroxyisobutyrate dehydrogenase-like beta-hydroxyacid dehydrogenase